MKQSNVFEFAEYNATSGPSVILHVCLLGVVAAAPRHDLHGQSGYRTGAQAAVPFSVLVHLLMGFGP